MREAPGRVIRRNNAPVRPRRPATSVPDLFFALATTGWAMAVFFFASSYLDDDVTVGEAGKVLARMFAGALAVASAFTFLLGLVLLRDERNQIEHFLWPMLIGLVVGVLVSLLFLTLHFELVLFPFLLLIFVLRPIRQRVLGRRRITRSVTR
jgi:hypothetical protein